MSPSVRVNVILDVGRLNIGCRASGVCATISGAPDHALGRACSPFIFVSLLFFSSPRHRSCSSITDGGRRRKGVIGPAATLGVQSSGAEHGLKVTFAPFVQSGTRCSRCAKGVYPTSSPRYAKLVVDTNSAVANEAWCLMSEACVR